MIFKNTGLFALLLPLNLRVFLTSIDGHCSQWSVISRTLAYGQLTDTCLVKVILMPQDKHPSCLPNCSDQQSSCRYNIQRKYHDHMVRYMLHRPAAALQHHQSQSISAASFLRLTVDVHFVPWTVESASERLHNVRPKRHTLRMHIPKQILWYLYCIVLRPDI